MSQKYYNQLDEADRPGSTTSPEMRAHSARPGKKDKNGDTVYTTEQFHKNECDVNQIISKYDRTGLISHISRFEGKFGDTTEADFKTAMDLVTRSQTMFMELPNHIRKRFKNSAKDLLKFMEDPDNRQEAITLGIIQADWTEETDGLGEHVKVGENVIIEPETPNVSE